MGDSATKFTERFIAFPIKCFNVKHEEMTGKKVFEDRIQKVYPFEIASYYTTRDEDTDLECINLNMKSGDSVFVYLTMEEFEEKLNSFYVRAL